MRDIIVIVGTFAIIGFAAWGSVMEGKWLKKKINKKNHKQ